MRCTRVFKRPGRAAMSICSSVVLMAMVLLSPSGTAHAAPYINPTHSYQLINFHSGKCLDVTGVSTANGALFQQYTCLGVNQRNQLFNIVYDINAGDYTIRPTHVSGKCLDLPFNVQHPGWQLQQWNCTGVANQRWIVIQYPVNATTYVLESEVGGGPGVVADVVGASMANGAHVQEWNQIAGAHNQMWTLYDCTTNPTGCGTHQI